MAKSWATFCCSGYYKNINKSVAELRNSSNDFGEDEVLNEDDLSEEF